jgi:hypothetical protein
MNKRLELLTLIALTIAFGVAVAAFFVGYFDRSLGYEDVILMAIATMTYLAGCEITWHLAQKEDDDSHTG